MKPAPLVALGLALNRGKSPYFVLISGRYTSRGRPDHLTTSEHSDRGCGEADSAADTGHRTEGPHGRRSTIVGLPPSAVPNFAKSLIVFGTIIRRWFATGDRFVPTATDSAPLEFRVRELF